MKIGESRDFHQNLRNFLGQHESTEGARNVLKNIETGINIHCKYSTYKGTVSLNDFLKFLICHIFLEL
jgi:hypothetical protein